MPVLKHHDTGGSEITGAVKHFYGLVSMADGQSGARHYQALGETCGRMIAAVRPPVLNVMDAIWVSHRALGGYPVSATHRANQPLASQDPVALDYWSAKAVLHPVDANPLALAGPRRDRPLADRLHEPGQLPGRHRAPRRGHPRGPVDEARVRVPGRLRHRRLRAGPERRQLVP